MVQLLQKEKWKLANLDTRNKRGSSISCMGVLIVFPNPSGSVESWPIRRQAVGLYSLSIAPYSANPFLAGTGRLNALGLFPRVGFDGVIPVIAFDGTRPIVVFSGE